MKVRKISEEKRNFRKKVITKIGLIVSLTGAIFTIYIGVDGLINSAWWEQYYFNILIFFGVLALIGVIIGFFYEKVGIGMSLLVGVVSLFNAPLLISGFGILSFLVFLVLIGGIIGLSANYENLKAWKEQAMKEASGIDEQMKSVYHLSLGLLICGWTFFFLVFIGFFLFSFFFLGFIGFFLGIIGLPIGFIGLYGIILYRYKPEKLRNYLQKRKEVKEEHI